jgi:flagella synthesis protein FlgN
VSARLTRAQAAGVLADGVRADLDACNAIGALLERQFEAAVRHRSTVLAELATELAPLLDAMEARRRQRVALVRALGGAAATMAGFIADQPEPARTRLAADWQRLEQLVLACQAATTRNSALLAEQYSVMQRVLHGEEATYAPR